MLLPGGFEGTPDPALYKRWFAFGALSSHSRLHGSGSYRVRIFNDKISVCSFDLQCLYAQVPWLIDETGEADLVLKKFTNLKISLMPYIYATAIETCRTGLAMM